MRRTDTVGPLEPPLAGGLKEPRHRLSTPALFAATWAMLGTGPWLAPVIGHGPATLLTFSACTAIAVGAQASPTQGGLKLGAIRRPATHGLFWAGIAAGWGMGPALGSAVLQLGGWLGLDPVRAAPTDWPIRVGTLLLAPLFEEIVYRERVFIWLQARAGLAMAAVLSSLAFALPHPGPWSVLAAFVTGLILAALRWSGGWLVPCIAIHAGLNLAGELAAAGAWAALLPPMASLAFGVPATVGVALWARNGGGRVTR